MSKPDISHHHTPTRFTNGHKFEIKIPLTLVKVFLQDGTFTDKMKLQNKTICSYLVYFPSLGKEYFIKNVRLIIMETSYGTDLTSLDISDVSKCFTSKWLPY